MAEGGLKRSLIQSPDYDRRCGEGSQQHGYYTLMQSKIVRFKMCEHVTLRLSSSVTKGNVVYENEQPSIPTSTWHTRNEQVLGR